jgi:hypothetical protein
MTSRLKELVARYGKIALAVHVGTGLCSLGTCYAAVRYGVDLPAMASSIGIPLDQSKLASESGSFVVAYVVHKALAPVRIGITVGLTPIIAQRLKRMPK